MSYSPPGQNPFNPYRGVGYQLPVFGNAFVQQPPPYHPSSSMRPPIPRPVPPQDVHHAPIPQPQAQPRPTTTPPTPPPGIPYIGARISLISNMNIRYEGTLYTIDPKEATVALQSVRCFGTEGRVPPSEEVAPSPHSYQFIIFRGKDIKDLHVCETPAPRFLPTQPPPPQDPAIVATGSMSPFGAPMSLGSFNKPEVKQTELEQQKLAEERFRLSSITDPVTHTESTSDDSSKQEKSIWTPGTTQTQVTGRSETDPKSAGRSTPPKSQPVSTKPSSTPSSTQIPTSQQTSSKKKDKSPGPSVDQSKSQYKPKPQSHQPSQGYPKQGPKSGQRQSQERKSQPSKGSGFAPPQKKQEKKKTQNRQPPQKRGDEDLSRPVPGASSGTPGVNYDGPGTGSYLGRRAGNPTIAPAIPQGEFDFQSSNARFDKDRFKEQVLKVAQKKTGQTDTPPAGDGQPSEDPQSGESTELTDLFKKLKSGTEKPSPSSISNQPSHLSPSATPFVPAAEGKKESKEKDEKESIDGVPIPDNLPTAPKYEKKNFYDDISTDRDAGQRRDMVKKDTETFGDIAANYGYYNRQRPRYFNSGGNYRGRGRGGGAWRGGSGGSGGSGGAGYGGGVLNGGTGAGAYYRAVQRI